MKERIMTYTKALLLLVVVLGFTACQDDETVYDRIVGRVWVGDLGFADRDDALESGVYFGSDGFGTDEQCFYDYEDCFEELRIRWWIDHGTLFIDYGNKYPRRELRGVYVSGHTLTGDLYFDGRFFDTVTLEMDN